MPDAALSRGWGQQGSLGFLGVTVSSHYIQKTHAGATPKAFANNVDFTGVFIRKH